MDRLEVFIASSHKDIPFVHEIVTHLQLLEKLDLISIVTDSKFQPGSDWELQIKKHFIQADILLLLISSDFLASSSFKNIEDELQQALMRQQAGDIRIIPIIIRPVSWRGTLLDKLQALPTGGKPITSWSNREAAYFDIVQGIRKVVAELSTPRTETIVRSIAGRINLVEEEEHLSEGEKLHLKNLENQLLHLEEDLRRSYSLLRDYDAMRSISIDPREKQNSRRSIEKLLVRIHNTLDTYMQLANKFSVTVPKDIIQASARIEEISEDIGNTENIN
jgi:hypothetical protein